MKRILALICFSSIFTVLLGAQPQTPEPRPKIALVLEGGGALGLAHIGVIEWLEQNRIPVDFVAGTSMGGLVGGFYATGKTPAEIREIVKSTDWDRVLSDKIDYQDYAFRRKQDRRAYPNSLEFGIRDGVRFPSGFSPGHQVGLLLMSETYMYSDMKSFDDLPIPFRCVGVDLVNRREKQFKDGSLADAMRSTMSLPAIFSPVRGDDTIYVDGGLLNNLPIDVARSMGADLVIAVHLRTKLLDPKEPLSSFEVLGKSVSVVVAANEIRSMEKADILITVDLAKYTSSQYERADALMKEGYDAVTPKAPLLRSLSVSEAEWAAYLEKRNSRKRSGIFTPAFIQAKAASPADARQLEKKLAHQAGTQFNPEKLEPELNQIVGLGKFSSARYKPIKRGDQDGLLIEAVEKEYAPPLISPLVEVDGSDYRNTEFILGARITAFDIGRPGTEWRTDVALGSEYRLQSEYYFRLRNFSKWFLAPAMDLESVPFDVYAGSDHVAQYRKYTAGGGGDIGYILGRSAELRIGYSAGYNRFKRVIGSTTLSDESGRYGVTSASFRYDGLDSPVIPRKGMSFVGKFGWHDALLDAPDPFPSTEVRMNFFKPVSTPGSIFMTLAGGTTFNHRQTGIPVYSLGGAVNLNAYGRNEFQTNQFALGRLGYLHRLTKLPSLLGQGLYGIGTFEIADVDTYLGRTQLPMDGTLGIVVDTSFGPLFAGASVGEGGHHKFLFRLGRVF